MTRLVSCVLMLALSLTSLGCKSKPAPGPAAPAGPDV